MRINARVDMRGRVCYLDGITVKVALLGYVVMVLSPGWHPAWPMKLRPIYLDGIPVEVTRLLSIFAHVK